jgi:hypothetical protein
MYGAVVRCKSFSSVCRACGLASMYPAFGWSVLCSGPPWISARDVLISCQTSSGPFGLPGFACAVKTDPPSLVSSSRRPRRELGCGATSSWSPCQCSSFVRAIRRFLRSGLQLLRGAARRGCQGWPLSAVTRRAQFPPANVAVSADFDANASPTTPQQVICIE